MLTSLVCIGDLHLAPGPRQPDRERALDQIIGEGLALEQLGAWLIPGDLFDAGAAAKDCNGVDERLQRMAERAPVVICYGNHDRPGDLDGFARLKTAWPILVIDRPQTVYVTLATGHFLALFVLPYPHRAGLVAAGVTPGDVVPAAADLLEPIFMVAAEELRAAAANGQLVAMMGHVNIAGAIASTGQPNIGREIELSPKHLERLGDIPKIFSHIHKPQAIAGAHYIGSICRLDYGEIEAKSYIVLTYDDAIVDVAPGVQWSIERRPIDVAPMFHVEGELTRDGFTATGPDGPNAIDVHRRVTDRDWIGCDVRVRYTYKASERAVLKPEVVGDYFVGALRLKVEGIAIADRELRAPAVATAKTLPTKLAAYRLEDALPERIAQKLQLLEHHNQAAVLDDVALELQAIEQPEKSTVAA